jgi:hypothetical protein
MSKHKPAPARDLRREHTESTYRVVRCARYGLPVVNVAWILRPPGPHRLTDAVPCWHGEDRTDALMAAEQEMADLLACREGL